ncbi:MAG: CZB domain-containing protein [Pseudomonadota bacterium]|nr:CZB domain-containing protein [Pseudomonadota bacterium]
MNFDDAVAAHLQWKVKFRTALTTGAALDASAVAKDNVCPIGQWLHGEAKAKYGKLVNYHQCVSAHAAFHREAGRVAQWVNQKDVAKATAALDTQSPFTSASQAAVVAIQKLKKDLSASHAA